MHSSEVPQPPGGSGDGPSASGSGGAPPGGSGSGSAGGNAGGSPGGGDGSGRPGASDRHNTPPAQYPFLFEPPPRTSKGSEGRQIALKANHFEITIVKGFLHHYDVAINPEKCPRRVNR